MVGQLRRHRATSPEAITGLGTRRRPLDDGVEFLSESGDNRRTVMRLLLRRIPKKAPLCRAEHCVRVPALCDNSQSADRKKGWVSARRLGCKKRVSASALGPQMRICCFAARCGGPESRDRAKPELLRHNGDGRTQGWRHPLMFHLRNSLLRHSQFIKQFDAIWTI
jgi:hypothetical protein